MSGQDNRSTGPTRIAIAVVRHDGKVLIGQRPQGVPLAGLWEFPGGKIEMRESPAAAAVRECLEETGLTIDVLGELSHCSHDYEHGSVWLHFFDCRPLDPLQIPRPPFVWIAIERLPDFEFPAANRDLLAQLTEGAHLPPQSAQAKKPL